MSLLFARPVLALAVGLASVGIAWIAGVANPWRAGGQYWMVWGSLIDIGCFSVLARSRVWPARNVVLDPRRDLAVLGVAIAAMVGAVGLSHVLSTLAYGSVPPPQLALTAELPAWARAYSVVLWPIPWAIAEQVMYLGVALPRLERVVGTRRAVIIVVFTWATQHVALPLILDPEYLVVRTATALPVTAVMTLVFVRSRRLAPLVALHVLFDIASALA